MHELCAVLSQSRVGPGSRRRVARKTRDGDKTACLLEVHPAAQVAERCRRCVTGSDRALLKRIPLGLRFHDALTAPVVSASERSRVCSTGAQRVLWRAEEMGIISVCQKRGWTTRVLLLSGPCHRCAV